MLSLLITYGLILDSSAASVSGLEVSSTTPLSVLLKFHRKLYLLSFAMLFMNCFAVPDLTEALI